MMVTIMLVGVGVVGVSAGVGVCCYYGLCFVAVGHAIYVYVSVFVVPGAVARVHVIAVVGGVVDVVFDVGDVVVIVVAGCVVAVGGYVVVSCVVAVGVVMCCGCVC